MQILDHPLVLQMLFHPRKARPYDDPPPGIHDGTIPVDEGVGLGYRLYAHRPQSPVMLYFHGNGEVASDYDGLASAFLDCGVSLLVVDYRGYGWSTGKPLGSKLFPDAEKVVDALSDVVQMAGLAATKYVLMGRSLGSACAIHAAHTRPDQFAGLIIESGFAHGPALLSRLGAPVLNHLPDPIGNERKMREISLPLLVIHGERDQLIPVENGQALYDASPSPRKRIVRVQGAGHNDLLLYAADRYFGAIREFVAEAI